MKRSKRKILSVSQNPYQEKHLTGEENEAVDEDKIVVGTIELALPCRHFLVEYRSPVLRNSRQLLSFCFELFIQHRVLKEGKCLHSLATTTTRSLSSLMKRQFMAS